MDFIIDCFDPTHLMRFEEYLKQRMEEKPLYGQMMLQWLIDNTKAQEKGEMMDWFGEQYEMQIKPKSKADALGQFYTPMSICRLMAKINSGVDNADTITVDDCACGSGRLLIAMEEAVRNEHGYSNRRYYTGADIDPMSVRMCALNLMIAGVCGQVLCRDTLRMETFYGYEINEVRYPFAVPFYSIRRITPEEAQAITNRRLRLREVRKIISVEKQEMAKEITQEPVTLSSGQLTIEFE